MKNSSLNKLTAALAIVALASLAFIPYSIAFGTFISGLIVLIVVNDYAPRRSLLELTPAGRASRL